MPILRPGRLSVLLAIASLAFAQPQSKDRAEAEGLHLFAAGKYRQAAPLLESASTASPERPELARALGLCYLRLRNTAGARVVFARLFGVPPDSAKALLLAACASSARVRRPR